MSLNPYIEEDVQYLIRVLRTEKPIISLMRLYIEDWKRTTGGTQNLIAVKMHISPARLSQILNDEGVIPTADHILSFGVATNLTPLQNKALYRAFIDQHMAEVCISLLEAGITAQMREDAVKFAVDWLDDQGYWE